MVETYAADDRRHPSAQVLYSAVIGPAHAQPGLLDGILRLAQRAQHPVRDRLKMPPLLLESLRQPVVFVRRSHSSIAFRHRIDEPNTLNVTRRTRCKHE